MKTALTTCLLLLIASSVFAGPIYDLQTGVYTVGDEVTVTTAVVTGVRYNGAFISEDPNIPFGGVWVYTGTTPAAVTGDLVEVKGLYEEYYDFSEINVTTDLTGYFNNLGPHTGTLYPLDVTIADLVADGEPYESCFIRVTDGMTVTTAPDSYGEWVVESWEYSGNFLILDDYWYDETTVALGDCYDCGIGILTYGFGAYKLEPFVDCLCKVDCAVSSDQMSFDQVKSLFR